MSRIFLPPKVTKELQAESRQYDADVRGSLEVGATLERFDRDLKAIDPRLHLVKAREWVKTGTALRPGFWHIVRDNEGAPPSVMTIEGPEGEYVEPNSSVFDMLRRNDWWRDDVRRERRRKDEEAQHRQERMRQQERQERQEEILDKYRAAIETRVSMNRSSPWSQSVAGRRG